MLTKALGAKRTALNLGWLESLHRPNVSLVNTAITQIRPHGIETSDGTLREHDVIIYATGADVPNEGVGVNKGVHGEEGLELKTYWDRIGGPQAYAGFAVPHVSCVVARTDGSSPTTSSSLGPTARRDIGG